MSNATETFKTLSADREHEPNSNPAYPLVHRPPQPLPPSFHTINYQNGLQQQISPVIISQIPVSPI